MSKSVFDLSHSGSRSEEVVVRKYTFMFYSHDGGPNVTVDVARMLSVDGRIEYAWDQKIKWSRLCNWAGFGQDEIQDQIIHIIEETEKSIKGVAK